MPSRPVTVSESQPKPYGQAIGVGPHTLHADEPETMLGRDSGPSPYELLKAALGACTNMTLRMYAAEKGWPLTHVATVVTHEKITDETSPKRDVFHRQIILTGPDLTAEQRVRLLEIADKCPVSRTLEGNAIMRTLPA